VTNWGLQVLLLRERDRVDDDVDRPEVALGLGEDRVDLLVLAHVAGLDEVGAHLRGERQDPVLERVARVAQADPGASRWNAFVMPQAIDRSLATPKISAFLPLISPMGGTIYVEGEG
jgi:hypothetical protein